MWRRVYAAAAVVTVLLAAACAEQPGDDPGQRGDGGQRVTGADPVDLLGAWELAGVAGESGDAVRLAVGEIEVRRDCGTVRGSWRANSYGMFVAYLWSGECADDISTPDWLSRATSFDVDRPERLLLDAQGEPTARLLPADVPTPSGPSEVPEGVQRSFAPAAPLPPELVPAAADTLVGRWVPAGPDASGAGGAETPHVELLADGSWRGSDGCNADGGRWVAGPEGALLAVNGAITLIGCDNVPVGSWLAGASRAGMDGDVLVLLDAAAEELGRLHKGA